MTTKRGRTEAEAIARRYAEKQSFSSQASNPSAADGSAPDWRNRARANLLARRYAKIKRAAESRRPTEPEPEPEIERRHGLGYSTQVEHSSPEQLERLSRETTRVHYSSTEEFDETYQPHRSSPQRAAKTKALSRDRAEVARGKRPIKSSKETTQVHYSSTEELDETYQPQYSSPPRRAKPMAFSRDREEIARGKRPVRSSGEKSGSGSAEVEASQGKSSEKTEPELTIKEMKAIFLSRGFAGTRYPHRPTMKQLGIDEDVECLFALGGLTKFMRNNSPAYQVETCHFLATLQIHLYEDHPEYVSDGGLGWITFKVRGKLYSLTTAELDALYGFCSGTGSEEDFAKEELKSLWHTIAVDTPYSSSRSKSTQIRHPAVRYLHKSIAHTMFARQVTGPVNQGQLQVIDLALKGLLEFAKDGTELLGDKNNTSLTFTMLNQFLNYREWGVKLHRKNSKGELSIGGVITPILVACEVPLISEPCAPRWLDLDYLRKAFFLNKTPSSGECLYQFMHPTAGPSQLQLPCAALASASIDFCPPIELLYQPVQEDLQQARKKEVPGRSARSHSPSASEDAQPESYHFEEYAAQKQHKGLWEAHKRIGLLQKWNKAQDKAIKALKSTVKELTEGWKEMKEHFSKSQGKSKSPARAHEAQDQAATAHQHDELPQPSTLQRSGSTHISSRRSTYDEPPRYSSFEPRQRKRKAVRPSKAPKPHQPPSPAYSRKDIEEFTDSFFSNY